MSTYLRGELDASQLRIGIVVSRWNREITTSLLRGAERALVACGASNDAIQIAEVPGVFEIPLACRALARWFRPDLIIALGCVVKGETTHFEHVSEAAMHGIRKVSEEFNLPITCGILTVLTMEQAIARAGDNEDNKGSEVALAAVETANLLRRIAGIPS